MKVFLSHSNKDLKIAEALAAQLSEAGMDVWLAENQVYLGDNWSLEVGKALHQARAMVVLLSPDAVESKDVRREVAYALSSPKFEGRLVPVVVRPTGDIPWFLQTLPMIHSRGVHGRSIKRVANEIVEALIGSANGQDAVQRIMGGAKAVGR